MSTRRRRSLAPEQRALNDAQYYAHDGLDFTGRPVSYKAGVRSRSRSNSIADPIAKRPTPAAGPFTAIFDAVCAPFISVYKTFRSWYPTLERLFVGLSILFLALLSIVAWLEVACDKDAVANASATLNWITQVDVCSVVTEKSGHLNQTSPALAIIERAQSVGEGVDELIDAYHELALYSDVASEVRDHVVRLVSDLGYKSGFKNVVDIRQSMASVEEDLDFAFLFKFKDLQQNARKIVHEMVSFFPTITKKIARMIHDVEEQPTGFRVLDTWFQGSRIGHWYFRRIPDVAMSSTLGLPPFFSGKKHRKDFNRDYYDLLADIKAMTAKLGGVRQQVELEEDQMLQECKRQGTSLEGKYPWLKSWQPYQAANGCNDVLPGHCCTARPQYVDEVQVVSNGLTVLALQVVTVRGQIHKLRQSFYLLEEETRGRMHLTFSRGDADEVQNDAIKLQESTKELEEKWDLIRQDLGHHSVEIQSTLQKFRYRVFGFLK